MQPFETHYPHRKPHQKRKHPEVISEFGEVPRPDCDGPDRRVEDVPGTCGKCQRVEDRRRSRPLPDRAATRLRRHGSPA